MVLANPTKEHWHALLLKLSTGGVCTELARTIYAYMVCVFGIFGVILGITECTVMCHVWCIFTVLANPVYTTLPCHTASE